MSLDIRRAGVGDLAFLRLMLWEAVRPEPGEPDPGMEARLAEPVVASYLEGWGREGDVGVVAESDGMPIGAAWCRLPGAVHGWGYLDAGTPEVVIAVEKDHRGRGVGRALLDALVSFAEDAGATALSLSMDPGDAAAMALYASAGFEPAGTNGDLVVMRRASG